MSKKSMRDICLEYDQQFKDNMKTAKLLVRHLQNKKEQYLAKQWLSRVGKIKSSALEVAKDRSVFLSYLIKVLKDAVRSEYPNLESRTISYDNFQDYAHEFSKTNQEEEASSNKIKFHSKWSEDQRTYVAVQPIPGRGALVYMAVSKNPGIKNWDLPTLRRSQT